jgi:hypothetical protein
MLVSLKSTILWDVISCSLVDVLWKFGVTHYLHGSKNKPSKHALCLLGLLFNSEDGGSTFLQNVGKCQSSYTAPHFRGQYLSEYCFIDYSHICGCTLSYYLDKWLNNVVGRHKNYNIFTHFSVCIGAVST